MKLGVGHGRSSGACKVDPAQDSSTPAARFAEGRTDDEKRSEIWKVKLCHTDVMPHLFGSFSLPRSSSSRTGSKSHFRPRFKPRAPLLTPGPHSKGNKSVTSSQILLIHLPPPASPHGPCVTGSISYTDPAPISHEGFEPTSLGSFVSHLIRPHSHRMLQMSRRRLPPMTTSNLQPRDDSESMTDEDDGESLFHSESCGVLPGGERCGQLSKGPAAPKSIRARA